MAQLAWRGFSLLAARIYSRLRWSVQMRKGCLAPSSQCLHAFNALTTANSSRVPHHSYAELSFFENKARGGVLVAYLSAVRARFLSQPRTRPPPL